jgi:hypothetical protein
MNLKLGVIYAKPVEVRIGMLEKRIKRWTIVFVVFLLLSGLTAFPIESELYLLSRWLGSESVLGEWISNCYFAVKNSNHSYPFLAYGTDWLAFAHIVIAIAFIGPLRDPVRNIWIYQFGMITCVLIFPVALIMGNIRGIPVFWQLVDCSFGVIGVVPLFFCYRWSRRLEVMS